ncbi:MAG: alpha/beta hydrolase family protein [Microcoleaceae cyanobacterium]
MSSTLVSPQLNYQPTLGPYGVKTVDHLVLPGRSGRTLPLRLYYPEGSGKFPVIVFSHGLGASKAGYSLLSQFWASYGYVCIHPTHADALVLQGKAPTPENLQALVRTMLQDVEGWQQRVQDVVSILDALEELEHQLPQFQGQFDLQNIGVGGHSYGAYTTQLLGGARIDLPGEQPGKSFADPRIQATLLLSPQGSGQQGLTATSWEQQKLPMMVMTGSRDQGAQGQGPDWKQEAFKLSPPGDKYLVWIEGAHHFSFSAPLSEPSRRGNLGRAPRELETAPQQQAIAAYIQISSLAFWDTYLKHNPDSKAYLQSDALEKYSHSAVSISTK